MNIKHIHTASVALLGVVATTLLLQQVEATSFTQTHTGSFSIGGEVSIPKSEKSFTTTVNKNSNTKKKKSRSKSLHAEGTHCAAIEKGIKSAKAKGIKLPIEMHKTSQGVRYVQLGKPQSKIHKKTGKKVYAKNPQVRIKKVKTSKGLRLAVEAKVNTTSKKRSRALCKIDVCPVIALSSSGQSVKALCKNPFKSKTKSTVKKIKPQKFSPPVLIKKPAVIKKVIAPETKPKPHNPTVRKPAPTQPRKPAPKPKPQPRPQAKPKQQAQSQQGAGQAQGFLKQLQNMFKKKNEDAKRKQQALLKKVATTTPVITSQSGSGVEIINNNNTNTNSTSSKPKMSDIVVKKAKAQDIKELRKINEQKCSSRQPKAIIIAQPHAVRSGTETTIKWASVCTASCKVTAQEVGIGGQDPILTEIGRKGDITGKLYSDTRFDLTCKNFNDKVGATSTVTVKLRK